LDVLAGTGSIKVNFPDIEVSEMEETCSLDVADRGGESLERVGELLNLTRERVRQLDNMARAAFARVKAKETFDVDWEERRGYVEHPVQPSDYDDVDCGDMEWADESGQAPIPVTVIVTFDAACAEIASIEERLKLVGNGLRSDEVRDLVLIRDRISRERAAFARELGGVGCELGGVR